jgi:hypothetical protein
VLDDSVVGPAPWYWKTFPSFGEGFEWQFAANAGSEYPNGTPVLFARTDRDAAGKQPVLSVRIYGRVLRANDDHILLWGPRHRQNDLLIETFELDQLRPIGGTEQSDDDRIWVTTADPIDRVSIPAGLPAGRAPGQYIARAASTLAEVLMLADGPSPRDAAISVYAWSPAAGTLDVMPQSWFNEGNTDLGYEWITRVTRDPTSGHIFGDGVRMTPFELDARGRWLRRLPNRPRERLFTTWLRELRRGRR